MDQVTFVIATYRRTDALRCALESLRLQEHGAWDAIVVGDCCDEETETTIRSIGDPRIAYYNLPQRCGEQSGPNSVGLALAEGDVVTFLNHDDLLLPDHISYGLECMAKANADFFFGKSANATRLDGTTPVFTHILPRDTDLRRLLLPGPHAFDPSSFWLVRTAYACRVGQWRAASTLWRTPLGDWLLRAWRLGGRFVFGTHITGLRFLTHTLRTSKPLYDSRSPEHEPMLERLRWETPDALRISLLQQIEAHADAQQPERYPRTKLAIARLNRILGLDIVVLLNRLRRRKGFSLRRASIRRTGADLPEPPDIGDFIARADTFRVL